MVAGGGEVGVDQAPAVEGVVGLPVAGDGLVAFGGFDAAFGGIKVTREPHIDFKKRVPQAIGLIRTGDTIQYANMILESA